ncbi:unnamed protein product [Caenorhabditis angaria]|uniref:ABC transporter domain-containing protein n=1 Tax=Caenorhabditis angaria TaxID=860376 RepID=A0A9P1N3D4_9PELO|nr:unnamed protein product [Caenorhabditis angaria]
MSLSSKIENNLQKSDMSTVTEPLLPKESSTQSTTAESGEILKNEELELASERFRKAKTPKERFESAETGVSPKTTSGKRLVFRDIHATAVKKKGVRQEILKGVTGMAKAGELTFIMGSSGAGKTTLLNILTGRNLKKIEKDGDVFVNGRQMTPLEMKKISAYVQQDDVFIGKMTVKETLRFSAELRSPVKLDKEERDEIVEELMVMMGLKKCEDTMVGSILQKSLSRGERKRLAFACEILTDPPILFCDEPTSGLDSFMSHQVMKALRKLCSEGKTVICTIHQPSTAVFKMADSLILLSLGHIAYQGTAKNIDDFFEKCGYPTPKFVNSPDHFMRVLSQGIDEKEEVYNERIEKIVAEYEATNDQSSMQSTHTPSTKSEGSRKRLRIPRTWFCQFAYVFQRSLMQLSREKAELILKLLQCIMIAAVLSSIYFGLKFQKDELPNFKGFAFSNVQMMHMLFMMPSLMLFWKDYPVVVREYSSNMYCPSAYFIAKTMADTIQYIIFPFIFNTILLVTTDLPGGFWPYFHFYAISVILSINATSMGQATASLVGDPATAMTVLPTFAIPFLIFGGFFISFDAVPIYFQPFAALSWYKYAFEAYIIMFSQEVDQIPGCDVRDSVYEDTCSTGAEFIKSMAFTPRLWLDYLCLILTVIFFKLVGIAAFTWRVRRT